MKLLALGITQKSAWFSASTTSLGFAFADGNETWRPQHPNSQVEVDGFCWRQDDYMYKSRKAQMAAIKGRSLASDHTNKTIVNVDEQVFRFNNRKNGNHKLSNSDRFLIALSQIADRRLTYAN